MGKNEIGNNRADSKKSVESKNCDELMTLPCVDTDSYKSPKSRREYARCLERQYLGFVRHGCTNKETRLYLKESPRSCEKELKSNEIDNI